MVFEVKLKFQTSFMLFLTIINALPVKQRMKNAFLENHIFTEYNLLMEDGSRGDSFILLLLIVLLDTFIRSFKG